MNFEKYKNDGWGLSKKEFEYLYTLFEEAEDGIEINVVEFGSGRSTEFLIDVMNELNLKMNIYSFDDSTEFAHKGTHPNLHLHITPLVECDDNVFSKMFLDKNYDSSKMRMKTSPVHTRQKNTFYLVNPEMLPSTIDLLIVDGPHGNGRSLAYLHCFDKLVNGAVVLIDDASHYPFYEHLKMVNNVKVLAEQHIREDKWVKGGDFIFCEIIK